MSVLMAPLRPPAERLLTWHASTDPASIGGLLERLAHEGISSPDHRCHVLVATDPSAFATIGSDVVNRASVILPRLHMYDPEFGSEGGFPWRTHWLRPGQLLLLSFAEAATDDLLRGVEAALRKIETHSTAPPLPNLECLVEALRGGTSSDAYVAGVEQSLAATVQGMCESDRGRRSGIGPLLGVLNFSPGMPALVRYLGDRAHESLQTWQHAKTEDEASLALRCADTFLHLAFELSPKDIDAHLVPVVDLLLDPATETAGQWLLFCRGIRDSFLKGIALMHARPGVKALVDATASEDAIGFRIIRLAIDDSKASAVFSEASAHWIFDRLMEFKRRTLLRLTHDLRRTVPLPHAGRGDHSLLYIDRIERALGSAPAKRIHGEVWMARCLLLLQTHHAGPAFLRWVHEHHARLGLRKADRDILAALCGFDVPLMRAVNERLMLPGVSVGIPPPSRYASVGAYMAGTLEWWARTGPKQAPRGDVGAPMVTVIVTTFKPDVDLLSLSLQSVIRQRYPSLEIVVIDDASPLEISARIEACITELQADSPHTLEYRRNIDNIGQYSSRNAAIAAARGEFIAIQDDDDISHPNRIRLQIEPMLKDAAIVATHAQHLRIAEQSRLMIDGDRTGQIEGDAPVSFIWRARVFREIGGFLPTRTRGDIEFRMRLRRRYDDKGILALPLPLVLMRGGLGTVSSTQEYFLRSAVAALRFMMDHSHNDDETVAKAQRWIPTNLR